ncbi:uncharacterized protein RJT20DRAFT_36119 [Scheffersomyces xylosifermentans]|uniref:uncharacterized protein n=1 Tax=Scheffersomyces xylosifermentans TaxID=1304137 RepID=UPI00315CD042
MASSNLTYVIPPYLLNTCVGSELQHEVAFQNEQMSLLNVISTDSPNFYTEKSKPSKNVSFSDDPYLNEIIKEKLLYKLAIIGALGDSPMEFNRDDNAYLYELFLIFKHRLLQDENEKSSSANIDHETLADPVASKTQPSVFSSTKVGEISFANFYNFPKEYKKYFDQPLREVLLSTKLKASHKYKLPPSFVQFDKDHFFNYPLPISWIPLVPNTYLDFLNRGLNLEVDNKSGYSIINLSTDSCTDNFDDIKDSLKTRFYNFISDKAVSPSTGIFYYEIEVEQEAAEASKFKPILAMNDQSICSDSSLNLSTGFTKRFINLETNPTATVVNQNTSERIDLEKIKNDIFYNENHLINESISEEIENLLSLKPGEFKGSFAVSFEDSAFYNSIKSSESLQRTAILNMNRRLTTLNRSNLIELDSGRIDIGVPFKTRLVSESATTRLYKTDTIGCGINFIDKSLFITLNGVLARIITEEELQSNSPLNDNLFSDNRDKSKDNSIYPMIGFRLNELESQKEGQDQSSLQIRTNFGFKEFKFNITNYVKNFKNENQRFLYLSLLDKIQSNTSAVSDGSSDIEKAILNINEDSSMLNKLIKGYLNHEGYLDTFKSFNADLKNLSDEIGSTSKEPEVDDSVILSKSHAVNRQLIKKYLLKNEFDLLLKFLSINYAKVFSTAKGNSLIFELHMLKFVYLLKKFIERKLNLHDYEFEFEFKEAESEVALYERAFDYRLELQQAYKLSASRLAKIDELSAVFLVKNKEGLKNLPEITSKMNDYAKIQAHLLTEINRTILQSLGFKRVSNLEKIFSNVSKNINALSLQHNDDKFSLVNFEKDHMDL